MSTQNDQWQRDIEIKCSIFSGWWQNRATAWERCARKPNGFKMHALKQNVASPPRLRHLLQLLGTYYNYNYNYLVLTTTGCLDSALYYNWKPVLTPTKQW